ncbi:uncharacterized protein LOC110036697 isoform X1 [Phalaenopsis equestris]|uniref:uncharacterized protein LOC110036697 isoform X1 n=1 Tax=Phalaenopsis equestris TaxID=78828 RepID=UPI0009E27D46|nr:uncharacterized protein LOC110036697 isoform X1 [Phalaenopsis equestris]
MRCSDDGQNWLPFGVLIKPQSKYCSNVTQQYEASMATKMAKLCSRIYRTKVVEAIKALKNALPYSETVLSQTRLTGEPSAHSFVHIEGFGHYLLHPQTYHQLHEEMIGNLLKSNPHVANELLEYKGLAIAPMDFAYIVPQNSLNPCSSL